MKGLFKKRTLPRFIFWITTAHLQENNQQGESSWIGAHEEFQVGDCDAGASTDKVNNVTKWSHVVALKED